MVNAYLLDLLWMLLTAVIVVPLFQTLRLGTVPGFVVAGLLVGPAGFGLVDNVDEITHFAEIGVVLLLFVIGIELNPSRLWLMRRQVFGLGTAQVLLTGLMLTAVALFLFGMSLRSSLLIGFALALSSTAFVLQILSEQRALGNPYGRAALSILLLQDLAVVPLLALVPLLAAAQMSVGLDIGLALLKSLGILVLVIVGGRYVLHPVLHQVARTGSPEVFTASALLIVLAAALATEHAGLSMAMGAFLAGLLISESAYRHQIIAEIQPFRGLLLGVFFMSMGMVLDLGLLWTRPLGALGLTAALMALKVAILLPLTRISGLPGRTATAVALLLAQSGEFALVLFALAVQNDLLSSEEFQFLLLVVLLSMLATPALARLAQRLASGSVNKRTEMNVKTDPLEEGGVPVVLAGFGRVGRHIGEIFTSAGIPFVALDFDSALVDRERACGNPVYYGDLRQPGVLKSVGAANARLIIVTLNDAELTCNLVAALRAQYPNVKILARGHNIETCQTLNRLGAAGVVSENFEASLELSRMAMAGFGITDEHSTKMLNEFRDRYNKLIHQPREDQ